MLLYFTVEGRSRKQEEVPNRDAARTPDARRSEKGESRAC